MDEIMSGLRRPVQRPVFHPAEGYQVELDDVAQQLRDLPARAMPRKEEQAERERLWDEQDRLAGLPAKAAWTEWVPVLDEAGAVLTVGAKWQASDGSARRQWLLEAGFTMRLSKPDMVREGGPDEGAVFSQTDAYFSEEAAIVFEWNGDEDAGLGRSLHQSRKAAQGLVGVMLAGLSAVLLGAAQGCSRTPAACREPERQSAAAWGRRGSR